jgi:hypothetical protein
MPQHASSCKEKERETKAALIPQRPRYGYSGLMSNESRKPRSLGA